MGEFSQIWKDLIVSPGKKPSGGTKRREYNRAVIRYKSCQLTINLIQEKEPKLAKGKRNTKISEARINKLLNDIYESCPRDDIELCHNLFIKGLAQGKKKKNWDVAVPSPMTELHRPKSPFTPDSFIALKALSALKKEFNLSIEDPLFYQQQSPYLSRVQKLKRLSNTKYSHLLAGQIIFSSIVNGGLLSKHWIEKLGEGIKNDVIVDHDQLWIELKITESFEDDEQTIHRRWFPDPLTALLILRWKKIYGDEWPDNVSENLLTKKDHDLLLEQYTISLGFSNRPNTNELIRAATSYLGLRVPQFLVTYASKHDIGLSLPIDTWTRLYASCVLKKPKKKRESPSPVETKACVFIKPDIKTSNVYGDQLAIIKKFNSVIGTTKGTSFLKDTNGICPILFTLLHWGTTLISDERLRRKKVRLKTMKKYVMAIAEPILIYAYILNLIDTDVTDIDWAELYDGVLEKRISLKKKKFMIGRINDFHFFLAQKYHCSSVNIKYDGRVFSNVNVNIVTPKEYQAVRTYLLNGKRQDSRIMRIQNIILSLGYRCGLRANEALNIKISELHDGQTIKFNESFKVDSPEILIKYNTHGKLKNRTSIRRVPLILLLADELKDLLSWKKSRIKELRIAGKTKIQDEPLFNLKSEDANTPKYHNIFPPILLALKEVTRDYDVNFHHLRHSFTNFLLLRLMSDDNDNLLPKEWYFDQTTKDHLLWKGMNKQKRASLRSRLLVSTKSQPTRKLLYLVSLLSGHIDPNVTMNSYLHLLDWVLGHSLRERELPLSLNAQANLLSLTPKNLKAYRSRNKLKGKTTSLKLLAIESNKSKRRFSNKQLKKMAPLRPIQYKLPAPPEEKPPSPFYLHNIFALIYSGKDRSLVAEDYEVSKEELYKWVHCAKKLASIKTSCNKLRFFKKRKTSQKQSNKSLMRVIPGYSPTCPIKKSERILAVKIYNKVHDLYENDYELARQGFNLFLKHASFEKMLVTTRTDEKRKLFVEFMKKLVTTNQIRVDLEPNPIKINAVSNEKHTHEKQMKYWRKELGLPLQNITIKNKSRTQATAHPNGKITIWIASDGKPENTKPINYIFRFALFMGMVNLQHCGNWS